MALLKGYLNISMSSDGHAFKLASNSQLCIEAAVEILSTDTNLNVHELKWSNVRLPDEPIETAQNRFDCEIDIKSVTHSQAYLAELQNKLEAALAQRNLLCTINAIMEAV